MDVLDFHSVNLTDRPQIDITYKEASAMGQNDKCLEVANQGFECMEDTLDYLVGLEIGVAVRGLAATMECCVQQTVGFYLVVLAYCDCEHVSVAYR